MPNALATTSSPYLLQHAENPVNWFPWGDEAMRKARLEQKPIFLSIGYSTCHWCHVMAHECFENQAVADRLNEFFVPIKVDREERPDVDRIYMTYVQAMTGQGGWPLNVWLTPDLKPFHGGTYFPPDDRHNRPGLITLLDVIARGWENERDKLVNESERVLENLRDYYMKQSDVSRGAVGQALHETAGDAFERCFLQLNESFDATEGGFGGAPKFPRASNLEFLFRVAAIQGAESETGAEALRMATHTLQQMARGGVHDHVGGGFHRYAVDDAWFVPHFEKMLYDQAQITVNYLDGYAFTGDERFAWVARGILDYAMRDLCHPLGGFFSAEDADSEIAWRQDAEAEHGHSRSEGAFYLWTKTELDRVLGEDSPLVCSHFGVSAEGNVPAHLDPYAEMQGSNVLKQVRPLGETLSGLGLSAEEGVERLGAALNRLRAVRALRPRPHLDDKVITAWNGLMISALARAAICSAECLSDKTAFYREAAERTARFLRENLYDSQRGLLWRSWRNGQHSGEGFAEDYAFLVAGLLDLYEATFGLEWLQWALQLQSMMDALFWDEAAGGYYSARRDDPEVILHLKEDYDGAEPSPNSIAAGNLARLGALLQDDDLKARAKKTTEALSGQWSQTPHALPAMLCSLERILDDEPAQVLLVGSQNSAQFGEMAGVARTRVGRHRVVLALENEEQKNWFLPWLPWLAGIKLDHGDTVPAYVCRNRVCLPPVTTSQELNDNLIV